MVLTGVLFPLVIAGVDPHHDHKRYLSWMLMLEAGVMGSFISLDLFLFFVFFEIVLVPMYFLIGGWGYDERRYAATKFFLYTMFGSAFSVGEGGGSLRVGQQSVPLERGVDRWVADLEVDPGGAWDIEVQADPGTFLVVRWLL